MRFDERGLTASAVCHFRQWHGQEKPNAAKKGVSDTLSIAILTGGFALARL